METGCGPGTCPQCDRAAVPELQEAQGWASSPSVPQRPPPRGSSLTHFIGGETEEQGSAGPCPRPQVGGQGSSVSRGTEPYSHLAAQAWPPGRPSRPLVQTQGSSLTDPAPAACDLGHGVKVKDHSCRVTGGCDQEGEALVSWDSSGDSALGRPTPTSFHIFPFTQLAPLFCLFHFLFTHLHFSFTCGSPMCRAGAGLSCG